MPPLSYGLCNSYEFCVSVGMYDIITPLQNCMVWREYKRRVWLGYSIRSFLHELMVNFM